MVNALSSRRVHARPGPAVPARTVLALLLVVGGCAPLAQNPPPETRVSTLGVGTRHADAATSYDLRHQAGVGETTVLASPTAVWLVLGDVFEQLEMPVEFVDASAGVMGNSGYRARSVEGRRMSRWLDCGMGAVQANADAYQVTLSVMVQLLPAEHGTVVRTTVDAYARDRSLSGGSVHCVSWGNLERRIPELVSERLEG